MDVLSSRILLRPSDLGRSRRFYRDLLGLAVYREFGPHEDPGVVFFLGQALLEVSGHAAGPPGRSVMIWIQVRDVHAEHARRSEEHTSELQSRRDIVCRLLLEKKKKKKIKLIIKKKKKKNKKNKKEKNKK